jgi:hypothetical protein
MLFFTLLHAGKDYGKPLECSQLIRLLVLGVKLQADDLVAQCATKLGVTAMDLETALGLTEAVPAEMDAYGEVKTLREHAWVALVKNVKVGDHVSD